MTADEIRSYIIRHYSRENESCEHKAFSNLKHAVSGDVGNDVISYVSAISNMNGGALVVGVSDGNLHIDGIKKFSDYTTENLPFRIIGNCTNLPCLGLRVEELKASDTSAVIWIIHIPKHSPRTPVIAHKKAWQRMGDSLTELSKDRHDEILHEPVGHDWSAQIVPEANIGDLDPEAILLARNQFKQRAHRFSSEVDSWSDQTFLDRAKLSAGGVITRAAVLLLGRAESSRFLSPAPAQITWRLETADERSYEHFGPPFLLNTSKVLSQIRNVRIKLFPDDQLLPIEISKYETRVILEALHNCIAHQNYEMNERIVVTEKGDRLIFENAGGFFDGEYERYASGDETPRAYRNNWLATAMVNVGMIDTMGYGIREMYAQQKQRFLPLPDYSRTTNRRVIVEIYGHVIDPRYSRLLIANPDLTLDLVIGIDRIQKKQPISDDLAKKLKQLELVEGRKPNFIISAKVADKTNQRAEYTRKRGLDDSYYKQLVIEHLKKFGPSTKKDLEEFLLPKLPEFLSANQKAHKVKNLLSALRMKDKRVKADRPGPGASWSLADSDANEDET